MSKTPYWLGVTSLERVNELLSHVSRALNEFRAEADAQLFAAKETLRGILAAMAWTVDSSNPSKIKALADSAVEQSKDYFIPVERFEDIWNFSQMFKKFEYGCQMTEEEACKGFLERNEALVVKQLPDNVRSTMRELLRRALPEPPCEPGADPRELSVGRFSSGSTYEGANTQQRKLRVVAAYHKAHAGDSHWVYQQGCVTGQHGPTLPSERSQRVQTLIYDVDALFWDDLPDSAKLQAVPKDLFKLRTITVEPLIRTWHQQAVRKTILRSVHLGALRGTIMDQILRDLLPTEADVGLRRDIAHSKRAEPRQKALCREAARRGWLATIDLSNASDTITAEDVWSVFPSWLVPMLQRVRSEYVEYDGQRYPLRMYAGMGNATTFPVETLFFWALLTALSNLRWPPSGGTHSACTWGIGYDASGHLNVDPHRGSVTVYGDDIVCTSKAATDKEIWKQVQECTNIQMNASKSGLGPDPGFREACGEVSYLDVSLPSTLRFNGMAPTRDGAARYCDFVSRCLADRSLVSQLFGACLAMWEHGPVAPLVWETYTQYSSAVAYFLRLDVHEAIRKRLTSFFSDCPVQTRRNYRLQRWEVKVWQVRAYTEEFELPFMREGSGLGCSQAWNEYQACLTGQRVHDVKLKTRYAERGPDTSIRGRLEPYTRVISSPVSRRTTTRSAWIPSVVVTEETFRREQLLAARQTSFLTGTGMD